MDRAKIILFLDHDAGISGSTVSMSYLIEAFIHRGYKVFVLSRKNKEGDEYLERLGAAVIKYKSSPWDSIALSVHFADESTVFSSKGIVTVAKDFLRFFNGLWKTFRIAGKLKPDIVYINEYNMSHCGLACRLLGIPSFVHVRSQFLHGTFGLRNYLVSKLIAKLNRMAFPITDQEAMQVLRYNKNADNIKVVPEFLGQNDFLSDGSVKQTRYELGLPEDKKIILMLGGVDRLKGTFEYLKSIKKVAEKNSGVLFLLAGEIKKSGLLKEVEDYYSRCTDLINSSENSPYLKILGHISNVHDYMYASDILVSASTFSHFSRPVIEAWALRKAVITTDTPHAREYVEDQIDGLFVGVGKADELAHAIISLICNPGLYEKLADNGYKKAVKNYGAETNARMIVDYCESALRKDNE